MDTLIQCSIVDATRLSLMIPMLMFHFASKSCIFIAISIHSNQEEAVVKENLSSASSQYLSIN